MSHPMVELRDDVFYPASDGEPVAETDIHRQEMFALIATLEERYRDEERVYVAGDNFLYYERGNPAAVVSPDVYLVRGVQKGPRRVYKLWEEVQAPCFVFELSSRSTWLEDVGNKKALCARLGVSEYWLYDPEAEVLDPPLQGFVLQQGEYRRLAARPDGSLESEELGLRLSLDRRRRLHCTDARTGQPLLRPEELTRARRQAEQAQAAMAKERDQAARERDQAQRRAAAAERELAKLRDELA